MRKLLFLSLLVLPLATVGLTGCGDENEPNDAIGAGGTGGGDGTGGSGGSHGTGGTGGSECENTRLTCDECVTPEENTYQACSPHTENCVPFDNAARVPGYPNDIPVVP